MTNVVLDSLNSRRSCRSYKPQQITKDELAAVLDAGTWAPTAMGTQEPLIVVVQDPEKIARIERMNAAVMGNPEGHPFYGAPTLLIVFADASRGGVFVEDGSVVMGNLLNAAHAVGLGSCWIHRAREVFQTEEGKAMMKEWGVPENYAGIRNFLFVIDAQYIFFHQSSSHSVSGKG